MAHFAAWLAVLLLFQHAGWGAQKGTGLTPKLELTVKADSTTAESNTLDLGLAVRQQSTKLEMMVKNIGASILTVDVFAFGNNTRCEWKAFDEKTGLKTRTTIPVNETRNLEIRVYFDDSAPSQIVFMENGREIAYVGIDYQLAEQEPITMETGQSVLSAFGEGYSDPYIICLGPAPPDHTLDPTSVRFFIESTELSKDHPRSCGGGARCTEIQKDDKDVCYTYTVQGHNKHGALGRNPENATVYVGAYLGAKYFVKDHDPKLRAQVPHGLTTGSLD